MISIQAFEKALRGKSYLGFNIGEGGNHLSVSELPKMSLLLKKI